MRILIDGQDDGQCFTTWENYYRVAPEQAGPPNNGEPPNINSLQFRTSVPGPSTLANTGGYLFDNVTVTTGTGSASPGCDVTIDKQADSPTVTAGGLVGYRISARNRGHLAARNLLVCDHIPRGDDVRDREPETAASRRPSAVPHDPTPRARPTRQLPHRPPRRAGRTAGHPGQHRRRYARRSAWHLPPAGQACPYRTCRRTRKDTIAALPPIAQVKVLVKIVRAKSAAPPPVTG